MPGLNADVREPKTEAKHYIGESVREEHVMEILFFLLWVMADVEMLRLALVGYQAERQKIERKNQSASGATQKRPGIIGRANQPRRTTTTATVEYSARKRIADAQRKR
jgi:hypothetical protein